jgi:hypothetical protein
MSGVLGNSKPTASLSSGLLARKGQARPAMKPQGYHGTALNLEDLGWNDMGDGLDELHAPMPTPAPVRPLLASVEPLESPPVPSVLVEREVLREEFAVPAPVYQEIGHDEIVAAPEPMPEPQPKRAPKPVQAAPVVRPVSVATAARIQREVRAGKPKSAFTLRLDAERHLRLRLASACRNRSAQALVTEALDVFIASLPEVEPLVSELTRSGKTSRGKS